MWDYKVVSGTYSLDGSNVVVKNQMGEGTLQRVLDHYGNEGFELASSNFDNINREVVLLMKRRRGGGGEPLAETVIEQAAPQPAAGGKKKGGRRKRSKAELDRLYRD